MKKSIGELLIEAQKEAMDKYAAQQGTTDIDHDEYVDIMSVYFAGAAKLYHDGIAGACEESFAAAAVAIWRARANENSRFVA